MRTLFVALLCLCPACQHTATRVRVSVVCWYGEGAVEVDTKPVAPS